MPPKSFPNATSDSLGFYIGDRGRMAARGGFGMEFIWNPKSGENSKKIRQISHLWLQLGLQVYFYAPFLIEQDILRFWPEASVSQKFK